MTVLIRPERLRGFTYDLLTASGSGPEEADTVADHLVGANLAGHDSHGVGMLPAYMENLAAGRLVANRHARLISRTGAISVEIELSAPPSTLRSGQVAHATLQVRAAPGATTTYARVPAEAVLEASGQRGFVFRFDRGKARRTPVTFGGFDGDDALVSGLADGTQVITAGAGFIADGEAVRVIP